MNEIYEDDYIDFVTEEQESTLLCPSCQWFDGNARCLKDESFNFDGGVNGVTVCTGYEKIN